MANVAAIPWRHALATPERVAVRGASDAWSYERLRVRIAAVGGALREAGVGPGARVLLVAPGRPEFVAAYYGIHAAGAIAVTANTMATRSELSYLLDDAGCALALAWHDCAECVRQAAAGLRIDCWTLDPGLAGVRCETPLAQPHGAALDDTAAILYTSGTTGRPKGAQLTHGNLRASAERFVEVLKMTPDDVFGTALPLFHSFGQAAVLGTTTLAGASVSLQERFDAEGMIEIVRRDGVTILAGVPTMFNALLHVGADVDPTSFAGLRIATSGGASLPAELIHAFDQRFGCVVLEGYGLTETTASATFNGLDRPRKIGAVGIPLPGLEVRVVGPDGAVCGVDEVGEVLVRGPNVMKGYWNDPDATAEALVGGWLHTGDLGRVDADGDLWIVDRMKDLIIRGGYNVFPREVEEVLHEHRDVVEVAVVGVPDDHFGEEVAAVVALRPGAERDPLALRAWAKERLSAYKVPRLFQFVDALPRGSTGKVLKRAIDRAALVAAGPTTPDPRPTPDDFLEAS